MVSGLTVNYTDRVRTKQNSRLIADSLRKIWSQAMEKLRLIGEFTKEILLLEFFKEKVFLFRVMNAMRGGLKNGRGEEGRQEGWQGQVDWPRISGTKWVMERWFAPRRRIFKVARHVIRRPIFRGCLSWYGGARTRNS